MNPITGAELAELKRLHDKVTPPNWTTDPECGHEMVLAQDGYLVLDCSVVIPAHRQRPCAKNARFIAAVRNAFPAIVARLDAAERMMALGTIEPKECPNCGGIDISTDSRYWFHECGWRQKIDYYPPTDAAIAAAAERINSMYYPEGSFAQEDWLRSSPPTVQHITNLIRELLKGGSDAKAT